jgi:hypothetical protein
LRYDLELAPGAITERCLAIPFGTQTASQFLSTGGSLPGIRADEPFAAAVQQWKAKLDQVQFRLPPVAQAFANTCKTAAAHILINRAGPALQPGPRRYTRCWIRDGATMAAALLRLGCTQEIAEFIRWYATYQAADGNVPAIVDDTGIDWLPEHDSHGEFIYIIMAYFRFTGDWVLVSELWPAVVKAVNYIEHLRNQRLGADYQTPEKRACYGLLPESASHEGYLAHPVHAYWDDFWALRGLKDAAALAEIVGDAAQAQRIAALRDDFQDTLYASIPITIAERHIPYIPGSVEWADFDPTATANAIALLDALPHLPAEAVSYTFDEYLAGFRQRHGGDRHWVNYTPYEIRIIGALVRLGRREDANELARVFLSDRRPLPWNQWPEIAWREFRSPGHLGDLPHTWIAAEYILAFCSLFAFEREADQALVIAAGLAGAWLNEPGGVAVENLPTLYGRLSYTLKRLGDDTLRLALGDGLTLPPGKLIVQPPLPGPLVAVAVNGQSITTFAPASVTLDTGPAEVILRHAVAP